jgi:hypothetical protein
MLVDMGYRSDRLAELWEDFTAEQFPKIVASQSNLYSAHSLLEEIGQGAGQIVEIVKALKSYTYLDQAPIQLVDVHEGLDDTLVMLRNKLKADSLQLAGADLNAERAKLRKITGLSLKLLNFAKNSILPGETVIRALWQPEIQAEGPSLLGRRISRTISAAHLSILTDKELIIVRDNPSKDSKYGATRIYIPLGRITSVSLDRKKNGWLVASLHFPENDWLDSLYSPSNGTEVERFLEQLGSMVSEMASGRRSAHGG